ncbi:MAG: hypothetical protein D6798_05725 [Deltaproteobacteria bacterium]|nr:MAG: hypothetical protein D6798_05725 [Deltaproteobacteria bacterium]
MVLPSVRGSTLAHARARRSGHLSYAGLPPRCDRPPFDYDGAVPGGRVVHLLLAALLGCNSAADTPQIPDLRPASELKQGCYGWPEHEFARGRELPRPRDTHVKAGDPAVDFTLKDVDGKPHRLADLLAERPVLLVEGSYTCNVFQSKLRDIKRLARMFKDDIHTVIVYNIEAHPKGDPSPYRGREWTFEYSDRGQPHNYAQRVKHARDIDPGPDALLLVDALEEGNANPFWCTYGSCPNCAFLVNQDGRIEAVHDWFDGRTMKGSIQALLQRERAREQG